MLLEDALAHYEAIQGVTDVSLAVILGADKTLDLYVTRKTTGRIHVYKGFETHEELDKFCQCYYGYAHDGWESGDEEEY